MLTLAGAAPLAAQGVRETQLWGVALASRPAFAGAGVGMGWRDARRTRIAVAVAAGASDGAAAGRAEAVWHFLLDPGRRVGNGVYAGAGLALDMRQGDRARPFLELVVGAEGAPGGTRGSFIEVGFGGGARVAAGIRWRKRNAPRR